MESSYGLGCYEETENGLLFKFGFGNRSFLISWLLGFGSKVKVLKPDDIAAQIKSEAEKILMGYNKQGILLSC